MVEILPTFESASHPAVELLSAEEVVAVVDDSPEIVALLSHYLRSEGFTVVQAGTALELLQLIKKENIALLLLDIGLPDKNGDEVLRDIVPTNPNLGIIMVTGTTDIEIALRCLREGADDYLTKPLSFKLFNHTVKNTLKKRRLVINNHKYQREIQITNTRMQFLHHLNLKLNTAYLNSVELEKVLQTILLGITADDGMNFNRAILALYDESSMTLAGKLAVGPSSHEIAGKVWHTLKEDAADLDSVLQFIENGEMSADQKLQSIVGNLQIHSDKNDHILIYALKTKQSVTVENGLYNDTSVEEEFMEMLGVRSFVIVPLYSSTQNLGVIIVDNSSSGTPVKKSDVYDLEIFASQASIAIEHSRLYHDMAGKISELQTITRELEKNKDLLVDAERESTIGRMSSRLLHTIRNPLTSIGGTSRLLSKKTDDRYLLKFLSIITEETEKIERTLDDLFTYAVDSKITLRPHPIYALIRKTTIFFYNNLKDNDIELKITLPETGPAILLDENKIRQLLVHLIKNSIESMPGGGVLEISSTEEETRITIRIHDTGCGIKEDDLANLRDPFFTTKSYGIGMGLAVVDQIMENHGGTFHINSAPGAGTDVFVSFPLLIT